MRVNRKPWVSSSAKRKTRLGASVVMAVFALAMAPASQASESGTNSPLRIEASAVQRTGGELYTFYAHRDYRPLWFDDAGALTPAASALLRLLETAADDGLSSANLKVLDIQAAVRSAAGKASAEERTRAELALSKGFAAYVEAMRSSAGEAMIYEHRNLQPQPLGPYNLLSEAASSSLFDYVDQMKWMHPLYAPLRARMIADPALDERNRAVVVAILARLRGIPNARRHILVDVASARLWMYENGKPVDTMRVVVGKPATRTPLLAGYIRYAITNPYWNVPSDMVANTIARNVIGRGTAYLKIGGYQVLSDWSVNPAVVDPKTIDWQAARSGTLDLRVRQLPRAGNFMGKVKYEFPNPYDIYLHDTPSKDLMLKDARQFSNGCIRLEDAQRLGRWLMQGELPMDGGSPEHRTDLPRPVPIYITYMSAQVEQGRIAFGPDPYGLDARPTLATGVTAAETSRR